MHRWEKPEKLCPAAIFHRILRNCRNLRIANVLLRSLQRSVSSNTSPPILNKIWFLNIGLKRTKNISENTGANYFFGTDAGSSQWQWLWSGHYHAVSLGVRDMGWLLGLCLKDWPAKTHFWSTCIPSSEVSQCQYSWESSLCLYSTAHWSWKEVTERLKHLLRSSSQSTINHMVFFSYRFSLLLMRSHSRLFFHECKTRSVL
jgi:hypothetical protein